MPSESEIIITFLFKRSGKSQLSYSDLYLTLSMDLNWFTPDDAKLFVDSSLKNKLMLKKGGLIQPNFEYEKITVPVGFTPSKIVFEEKIGKQVEKERGIFDEIVKRLAKETKLNETQITEEIMKVSKEENITVEVAALLVGKEYNISLEAFLKAAEERIFIENRE